MLPPGGGAAKKPRYVNCVENGLGLPEFLKGREEVVCTADKEGSECGVRRTALSLCVPTMIQTARTDEHVF